MNTLGIPCAALALATVLAGGTAAFEQPGSPTLPGAVQQLQSGDAAGAMTMLDAITTREPLNGRAWRVLAAAARQTKQFDRATAANLKALEVEPGVPTPLYSLGVDYALTGDTAHAFEWLEKAKATHRIDMTQIEVDPNLILLKADPRFKALLPAADDFANPFVEPTTIIREWDGEASGDQFGWIARNIGDVDGDRIPDVVTSAPTKDIGGANAGRVYVYSTRTGKLLWTADGHPGDQLGSGLEGAGDTNHDGVPDVIASAPGGGYANVYSGRDGHILFTMTAEDARKDSFGRHAAGVGDVNHDGFADVIVGAPGNSGAGEEAGRAYIYSGKDGALLLTLSGEHAGDGFGSAVAGASDGKSMLILVGAPKAGGAHHGRAYVYDSLSPRQKFVIEADETGNALGAMFLAVAGDVDGDGVPDVYASDWSNTAKGPSTGRVYVHSGKDGHRLFTFTGETAGEGFGTSPSNAGDVDGDGHADFIVGAWQYAAAAASGGRAYLYSGKDGSLLKTVTCRIPGDAFGFDSVGMGDVDGDGTVDFLITSAWSGIHGFHSGRVFIVSSGIKRK
jgi:hypothetical protein